MVLDNIRKMAREKKDKIMQNPNSTEHDKRYVSEVVQFFSNEDYIKEASSGLVKVMLYYLGVEFEECDPTYDNLMKEINVVYKAITPEMLAEELKKK